MQFKVFSRIPKSYRFDMKVFLIAGADTPKNLALPDGEEGEALKKAVDLGDFKAKEEERLLLYMDDKQSGLRLRLLFVGLGKDNLSRELFRKAGGVIAQAAGKYNSGRLVVVLPELGFSVAEIAECLSEGMTLGAYSFRKYFSGKENDIPAEIQEVSFLTEKPEQVRKRVKRGSTAAQCGCFARDMANEPANSWSAVQFADTARELAGRYGMKVTILEQTELKQLGMGGLLGVNKGSSEPAKMILLEYRTGKKVPTVMLVGKGLTFDSGGISLKPGAGMEDMKYDMCGGAAVLAAMQGVGEEMPCHVDVVAVIPATDNMPGPGAQKPGDVVRIFGGKTVEVINTDAEGRLILADALAYGIDIIKPDAVVDIATLTGAVIIGLGHHRTGLLSNNDTLAEKVSVAADQAGEPVWRLPLAPEYRKQLKSDIADIRNVSKQRDAGTITAACFLQEFVGEVPWVHLDIAGTAWNYTEKPYIPKGCSGIGARTLLELVRNWR